MPKSDADPDWKRINLGRNYALRYYPGVVGEILSDDLESWATNGYRFGGKQLIERLLLHLDQLTVTIAQTAGEDIGVVVHRAEVEG